MAINGKRYAWEDVTINLPHGVLVDVESISYEDERPLRRVYGKGSRTRGYSQGNYAGKGSLELQREEYQRLSDHASERGVYGLEPFDVTVSYANADEPVVTDILQSVKFVKRASGSKQDDDKTLVTLDFEVLDDIRWDDQPSFEEGSA